MKDAILVKNLSKTYNLSSGLFRPPVQLHAVADISFSIPENTTFGLVGESGSGKTTTAKMLMGAEAPTSGKIEVHGTNIANLNKAERFRFYRKLQPVLQDPYSSLSPRMSIRNIVEEPLKIHGVPRARRRELVETLLTQVGLVPSTAERYPNELSGGQRQRVAIARTLALEPSCIVLDEPVSALDVSIQAQILNLLKKLQAERGVTYFLISHDLAVVSYMSDQIAVMYLGQIVEIGSRAAIVKNALHPYTLALISASAADSIVVPVQGEIPSPINPPKGCTFHTRCPFAGNGCFTDAPKLRQIASDHYVACHYSDITRSKAQTKT